VQVVAVIANLVLAIDDAITAREPNANIPVRRAEGSRGASQSVRAQRRCRLHTGRASHAAAKEKNERYHPYQAIHSLSLLQRVHGSESPGDAQPTASRRLE